MAKEEPGIGVDSKGNPVVDPTKNVLDLVAAAIQRQDDLREKDSKHIKEIVGLHAKYDSKLREAETARIDAIRAVDVGNVQRAAEVQATQALTLATQVTTSAEALRAQVAATAAASDTKLITALEPIQKDIADLRRVQYEGVGSRTGTTDSRASTSAVIGYIVGAIGVLSTLVALVILLTK